MRIPPIAFSPIPAFSQPQSRPRVSLGLNADEVRFSGRTFQYESHRENIRFVKRGYHGPAQEVPWSGWVVADLGTPLATTGLETCRALAIVDDEQQFLAHIYPSDSQEEIEAALAEAQDSFGLNLEDATVSMILGTQENTDLEIKIQNALDALSPGKSTEMELVQTEKTDADTAGCALVRGEIRRCRNYRPICRNLDVFKIDPAF